MPRSLATLAALPLAALGIAAALALSVVPAAAQVVDTRASVNVGFSRGIWFGRGGPSVLGQSFTAPTAASGATLRLEDLTFFLYRGRLPPAQEARYDAPATFQAGLIAFDGANAVGDVLFTSALVTGPAERETWAVPYVFDVGGLRLTPGAQYLAYILDDGQPGTSHTALSTVSAIDYASGVPLAGTSLGTLAPYAPPPQLGEFTDLPFVARFSTQTVTPEPATVALVGGGLLALGAIGRRRRRATTALG